jgi:hypothetical protein
MAFSLFNRKKDIPLKEFLTQVKDGERNFHTLLKTKEGDFKDATFDQLMSNEDDVLAKVNRVQMNFKTVYFDLFDNCLIKHHDDGEIEFVFYTTTDNTQKIIDTSEILFDQLGNGFFDSTQFTSFRNHEKIILLAKGIYEQENDAPMHIWHHDNLSFGLHYRISPLKQLSLIIAIKPPKQVDNSVRRKGTILDLLHFDPKRILSGEPVHLVEENSGGQIKFVDYTFALEQKEFDIFNVVEFRIFDDNKSFRKFVQTHVTLYAIGSVDSLKKIEAVNRLYRIYGNDSINSGELEFYEIDKLEKGSYWLGRTWRFNEAHSPLNLENPDEKMSYEVRIENTEDHESFKISIFCYDALVALFGTS